jgi:large subunit ribosomal protein L6
MSTETIAIKQSRVGKIGVPVPKGVTVTIQGGTMKVKGPKGDLTRPLPPNVDVKIDAGIIKVMPTIGGRDGARFQGLTRALLNIMVKGVSESFTRVLELKGTGYRAEMKGQVLNLALGFSHPVNFAVPKGIVVTIPAESKGTLVILTGADKEVMGQTAATIRGFRPPEPYGGKGVRYQNEKVRQKAGKAAGKGGK